jgi:hypothetical protein
MYVTSQSLYPIYCVTPRLSGRIKIWIGRTDEEVHRHAQHKAAKKVAGLASDVQQDKSLSNRKGAGGNIAVYSREQNEETRDEDPISASSCVCGARRIVAGSAKTHASPTLPGGGRR